MTHTCAPTCGSIAAYGPFNACGSIAHLLVVLFYWLMWTFMLCSFVFLDVIAAKRCVPSCFRKGAQIKSYLISIALITAGFKMYQQIDLYMLPTINMKCVSLYYFCVKISLVHQASTRCVLSSSTRCVFKIYNVTRFKQLIQDLQPFQHFL